MSETLREKIEKLPVASVTLQAHALPIEFIRRDEVLAVIDGFYPSLEKLEIPQTERQQPELVIAKEQVRTLVTISQTLGSIHEELKHMNHG